MNNNSNITDIVVPINDFLLEADTVSGGLYICQNGGVGLLAKSANKDNRYVMKKFFGYLEPIESIGVYEYDYYYEDMKIPRIMMDHLLDKDTDKNILQKVKDHINKEAKWMDKKGILAITDMTFSHAISIDYRKINTDNMKLMDMLSKSFTVHLLGNCSRISMDNMIDRGDFKGVNGNIVTSSDLGTLKCSKSGRYDIYEKFLTEHSLDPTTCLFFETHPGNITAIHNYAMFRGVQIRTILYQKDKKRQDFVQGLSKVVEMDLDTGNIAGEFVPSNTSQPSVPTVSKTILLLSTVVVDGGLLDRRKGAAIADTFVENGKLYEQLIDTNGEVFCTVTYSDIGHNNNERTIMLPVKIQRYTEIKIQNVYSTFSN